MSGQGKKHGGRGNGVRKGAGNAGSAAVLASFLQKRKPAAEAALALGKDGGLQEVAAQPKSKRQAIEIVSSSSEEEAPSVAKAAASNLPGPATRTSTSTSSNEVAAPAAPSRSARDFVYYGALERLEAKDRAEDKLPYARFSVEHYEPRGVSVDSLRVQFGPSPRAVFNHSEHRCAAFQFVWDHFEVPDDFDNDLSFGARSGVCFEQRVLRAYERGELSTKNPAVATASLKVCSGCGGRGHLSHEDACTPAL